MFSCEQFIFVGSKRSNNCGKSIVNFSATQSLNGPRINTGRHITSVMKIKWNIVKFQLLRWQNWYSLRKNRIGHGLSTLVLAVIFVFPVYSQCSGQDRLTVSWPRYIHSTQPIPFSPNQNIHSNRSTRWYPAMVPSSPNDSVNQLNCVLLKLDKSFESREELRWCFLRRKNERRADFLFVVPSPSTTSVNMRSSSSTLFSGNGVVR